MHIGILETGKLPGLLEQMFGNYSAMFSNLLSQLKIDYTITTYEVTKFQLPDNPKEADFWLITGSSFGVYDNLIWIADLKNFVQEVIENKVPLLGVCFGHQILAEAMGGSVEKSDKGWGVGVHKYYKVCDTVWAKRLGKSFSGYASHQDQVIIPPKNSISIYGSKFCPHSVLAYGNRDKPCAISIQSHPEFSKDCLKAIINRRLGKTLPRAVGEKGLKSLNQDPKNVEVFKVLLEALHIN